MRLLCSLLQHLLLSLGDLLRVCELLLDVRQPIRAMFLFEAARTHGALHETDLEAQLRDRLYEDFITSCQFMSLHRLARHYTAILKALQVK